MDEATPGGYGDRDSPGAAAGGAGAGAPPSAGVKRSRTQEEEAEFQAKLSRFAMWAADKEFQGWIDTKSTITSGSTPLTCAQYYAQKTTQDPVPVVTLPGAARYPRGAGACALRRPAEHPRPFVTLACVARTAPCALLCALAPAAALSSRGPGGQPQCASVNAPFLLRADNKLSPSLGTALAPSLAWAVPASQASVDAVHVRVFSYMGATIPGAVVARVCLPLSACGSSGEVSRAQGGRGAHARMGGGNGANERGAKGGSTC